MHRYEINAPCIDKVYAWGISILASMDKKELAKIFNEYNSTNKES